MPVTIREADGADVEAVARHFDAYLHEAYDAAWHGSEAALRRDALGAHCALVVAVDSDELVGFLGWISTYDLHHCVPGAEAIDLYVTPGRRGRGIALMLGCALARLVEKRGGRYLKGSAAERGAGRRLYARIAACAPNGECYVSGRAFRQLASLAGRPVRDLIRNLPEPAWNHE